MDDPNKLGLVVPVESNVMPSPEQCDVSNPALLSQFREKRDQWISWYSFRQDDPNSIEGQIVRMIFMDLSYRIIAKARGDLSKGPDIAARNGLLAHLLDQGYVATQILAIRRLLDRDPNVLSLWRLLHDIIRSSQVITRENFVTFDGTPYDPNGWQLLPADAESTIWGIDAPGMFRFVRSTERHKMFDKLSGKGESSRNRCDTISPAIFDRLTSWLESPEAAKLRRLSNKFFAHAADISSRKGLQYKGVLFKDIETIQRAIIRVERAITDDVLFMGVSRDVVALEPLGFLTGLDRPYIKPEEIPEIEEHWKELKCDRDAWKSQYETELYGT